MLLASGLLLGSGAALAVGAGAQSIPLAPAPGSITTIAGTGIAGAGGDGLPATQAQLNVPTGIAADLAGSLYIADYNNNKVRKVVLPTTLDKDMVSTLAGTGVRGFSGDGGQASRAELDAPTGVATDTHGDVFVSDTGNNRVREVTADGRIRTIAGTGMCMTRGRTGNAGPAVNASLCGPTGIAVDDTGNVYVSDTGHNEVRVIGVDGVIREFAGDPGPEDAGGHDPVRPVHLSGPTGLAIDAAHDVFIANTLGSDVLEVKANGAVARFAGRHGAGYSGDGGPATKAKLSFPTGVAVDQTGTVYISDTGNGRLRAVGANGVISTLAGDGVRGFAGDGGPASKAELDLPTGVAAIGATTVYFSDTGNQRIRGVFAGPPPVLPESPWNVILVIVGSFVAALAFVLPRVRRRRLEVA